VARPQPDLPSRHLRPLSSVKSVGSRTEQPPTLRYRQHRSCWTTAESTRLVPRPSQHGSFVLPGARAAHHPWSRRFRFPPCRASDPCGRGASSTRAGHGRNWTPNLDAARGSEERSPVAKPPHRRFAQSGRPGLNRRPFGSQAQLLTARHPCDCDRLLAPALLVALIYRHPSEEMGPYWDHGPMAGIPDPRRTRPFAGFLKGERPDSNRRPPGPQPGALPRARRPPRLARPPGRVKVHRQFTRSEPRGGY
jgi:hypothetical protein